MSVKIIPFKEAWKILPKETFRPIDEYQYERVGELTVEALHEIMEKGRHLMPESFHKKPLYPGKGYDEEQNTVVLMWNPAVSSFTPEDHRHGIAHLFTDYFNWSVWEHEKARCGDRFFLVRVGEGRTGIVMSGVFDSQPYEADDWSGRERRVFYMDMLPNVVLDPDEAPMLTTEQLSEAIPSFDWTGGHSGRLLTKDEAKTLEAIWEDFLRKNKDKVDGRTMSVNRNQTYEAF
ncbi:MAG: hypothetical protein ACI36X_02340 [Bacteroidaceae bacterium]